MKRTGVGASEEVECAKSDDHCSTRGRNPTLQSAPTQREGAHGDASEPSAERDALNSDVLVARVGLVRVHLWRGAAAAEGRGYGRTTGAVETSRLSAVDDFCNSQPIDTASPNRQLVRASAIRARHGNADQRGGEPGRPQGNRGTAASCISSQGHRGAFFASRRSVSRSILRSRIIASRQSVKSLSSCIT